MKKQAWTIIKITLSFLTLLVLISCSKSINEKPNIIIVMTDDQGYGDLGFNGNEIIKTPNLDQFASESINFTNYHVGTTCSPTRAGFITGRNCLRNGVWHTNAGCSLLNQDEVTIGDVFLDAGYETGLFGKWHLGDNYSFLPEQRGFKETFTTRAGVLVKHQIIGIITTRMIFTLEMVSQRKVKDIVLMFFLMKPFHL